MLQQLPRLIRFLLIIVFVEVALFTLLRIAFFIAFKDYGTDYSSSDALFSFWLGFRYDLQLALIANLPILIFGGIKYIGIFKSNFGKVFWSFYIFLYNMIFLLIYIIDFPYFDFFKKMVDSSIIRYFYDFTEALKMVQEGYPLVSTSIIFIIFLVVIFIFIKKFVNYMAKGEDKFDSRRQKILIYTLFSLVYIFGGYGKFELYPWRWSEAFYSSNTFLSYLASNPVTYFKNTLKNREVKYDINATQRYYPSMVKLLNMKTPDENNLSLVRIIKPNHAKEYTFKKPNIVYILGESTSYARSSISGNPLNPTPFLKEMSDNGLTYSRYYTPHSGTARSVWASMTALADVERMRTSSRNPMIVQQHMILNSLKDYEKYYFIGGSLSWGNVRGVVGNVDGIHTYEEQDYPNSPHNDVWGISDAHLAGEVNDVLKKEKKPFFAFVQLSGNHSPNTIPEENFGFKFSKNISKQDLLDYSFDGHLDELNGQRFLDHAVKRLITLAKKEEYFKNTIFIFVGDHGVPKKAKHLHDIEYSYVIYDSHTPLIIYAPELIKHKEFDYPVSEIDIMPTIAGLTGEEYINSTMGRDILEKDFDKQPHYAFYLTDEENVYLGLIGKEFLYRERINGKDKVLYKYFFDKKDNNLIDKYPKVAKEMGNMCKSIYEETRYIRYNNSPKDIEKRLNELKN